MPVTFRSVNKHPNSDELNCLLSEGLAIVSPTTAGTPNTTVQGASLIFPFNYKIRLVTLYLSAIDAVAGLDSFNLVIGGYPGQTGQTYTQGNIVPNDNSDVYGYPTNVGVAGQAVFGADVPFNAANLASLNTAGYAGNQQGQAVPNTGWLTLTTTGGSGLFVPTNYDAVYPAAIPLSLRVTTVASTGSITNLKLALAVVPVAKRAAIEGVAGQVLPYPATDY